MHISVIYQQIYKKFDDLTPVPFDCGALCDKLCCQGDGESGMYLFPGESRLFEHNPNFSILDSEFISGKKKVKLLVCHGPCKREDRPLSCRIFPLIPLYRHGCTLQIIPDPRASICPLTHPVAVDCITPEFWHAVEQSFRLLVKIPKVAEFLHDLSYLLDEYHSIF